MLRSRITAVFAILLIPLLFLWSGSRLVSAENTPPTLPRMMEPEFPTITGTKNNLNNPTFGAAHTNLRRFVPSAYADGFSEPRGGGINTTATLPSARDISNIVATQTGLITNALGVSDLFWQMFQLLDHDLDLTEPFSPAEPFDIIVNLPDPLLTSNISLSRSIYDEATGTTDPRQQINEITTWIDASNVYGSDLARANWKRADHPSGVKSAYLITSTGNLLPIEMGTTPNGLTVPLFAAGDIRASEQSGLTAVHTLWMREHNRLVDYLRAANPSYTEEQLYQRARALVSAEMQIIIYNEMLPLLLGPTAIPAYDSYDASIDPSISNAFSTAAFRFGHTMLSPQLRRLDPTGNSIPAGDLPLRDAFFNIQWIQDEGIESILRGLMTQPAQELDAFIIDDVRSFLFAPVPGSPGSDLAALNMQRGREHGLPSYNATRTALGLTPAATFADITSDTDLQTKLSTAYGGDINAVDLWIAGLAEDNVAGAMVGETFHAILLDQFLRLRDGDRFWHANRDWTTYGFAADPLLDDTTPLSTIRLADIIHWNTNITLANDDVLMAGNVLGGTGRFYSADARLGHDVGAEAVSVISADFDNDGDPDIAAAFYNHSVRIYRNDGGTFIETQSLLSGYSGHALEAADFNQDGFIDLLVGNWQTQPNQLFLNSAGIFAHSQDIGTGGRALAVGDLNGDNLLDIVLGKTTENNSGGEENEVWLASNDGLTFTQSGVITGKHDTVSIQLALLDDDEHLDLVVGNTFEQPDRIYIGQGDGSFTDSGQTLGSNSTNVIKVGDLNGDGNLDLFAGGFDSGNQADKVYYGDGTGSFADSGSALGTWNTRDAALGDLNGDGTLDLYIASQGTGVYNRVFLNMSTDGLVSTGQLLGSVQTKSVALVDIDLDGDLDAVTGNAVGTGVEIWINDQSCPPTRLCNVGFEAGDDRHWLASQNITNTVVADGYNSPFAGHTRQTSSASGSVSWKGFQQAMLISEGVTYDFSGQLKAENVAGLHAKIAWIGADGNTIGSVETIFSASSGTFDWTPYSAQRTAPANARSANIIIWHGAASGANVPDSTAFVDDVYFAPTLADCDPLVLENGDFEQDKACWETSIGAGVSAISISRGRVLSVTQTLTPTQMPVWSGAQQPFSVQGNSWYYFAFANRLANSESFHAKVDWFDIDGNHIYGDFPVTRLNGSDDWTDRGAYVLSPANAVTGRVAFYQGIAPGNIIAQGTGVLLDDVVLELRPTSAPADRIANGDFSDGLLGWWTNSTASIETVNSYNGTPYACSTQTLTSDYGSSWASFVQLVEVRPNQQYRFTAAVRWANASQRHIKIDWHDSSRSLISTSVIIGGQDGTSDWIDIDSTIVAPADAAFANIVFYEGVNGSGSVAGGQFCFDNIEFVPTFSCAAVTDIPSAECEALVALYTNTVGSNWTNATGWLQDPNPCNWHGVTCLGERVSRLQLSSNNLIGTLPSNLQNLSALTHLHLHSNQLTGTIPPELGNLASLIELSLYRNKLSGAIPPELGDLSQLQVLFLSINQLSGVIPPELGNLSAVRRFHLYTNELSGEIPSELGNLSQVQELHLAENQLSGTIPPELGNLSTLRSLYLYTNQLEGPLPFSLGNLSSLQHLSVSHNQLSGALPASFLNLDQLARFVMANTQLCLPMIDAFQNWVDSISNFNSSGIDCSLQGLYVLAFDAEPTSPGNLSAYYQQTLNHLQAATLRNAGTRAIVLVDLDGVADTVIFVIENGLVTQIAGLPDENGVLDTTLHEYNTADGEQIGRFLKWARDTYSAEKEIVSFVGHGNALTPEADYATLFAPRSATRMNDDPLPTLPTYLDIDPTVTDAHTNDPSKPFDLLSTYDVRRALEIATDNGANPIEVLNLVHCFAATVEELFETSNPGGTPFAEMIVASPLYAYFSSRMPGITLESLDPNANAQTLATTIMTTYQSIIDSADALDNDPNSINHPGIITVVDASYLGSVKNAIDRVSANLISEFEFDPSGTHQKLRDAYLNAGIYYDSDFCAPQQFELTSPDAIVDLGTFMSALDTSFANSRFNVDLAALAVKSVVDVDLTGSAVVTHSVRSGTPWFAGDLNPDWTLDHSDLSGLGLYADLGGKVQNGRTIISWHYPFYIDESAETGLQFVKNGTRPSWSDVLTTYWADTDLDLMACLPELPPTRSVGEIGVVRILLAQGALNVGQMTDVGILVQADTLIENSLLEVIITHDETNTVVYSDTVSTGYLLTGTHEIVMGLPFTPTIEGEYTVTPTIDSDDRVAEANEDDNLLNNAELQRIVVHEGRNLTIDVQTADGREWFDSHAIDLTVTSTLDGAPTNLEYIVCDIFELSSGAASMVHVFERTETRTDSNPSQPAYTLMLPDSVAAGRIEVQCRGIANGEFTGRPAEVAFNLAPGSSSLANGSDHYVFTRDSVLDTLDVTVSAENGPVTVTVWTPFSMSAAHQITVPAGATSSIDFPQTFTGEYMILVEGTANYTISGLRNGNPGRRATTFAPSTVVQRPRPTFISAPANVERPYILEIMDMAPDTLLNGTIQVEIKVDAIPTMDSVELYLNGKFVSEGVLMLDKDNIYSVEFDTSAFPSGKQMLMAKVMGDGEAMAQTDISVCIEHCEEPSAITLRDNAAGSQSAPVLLLVALLLTITLLTGRRPKRVV